jgi:hypothetical protein
VPVERRDDFNAWVYSPAWANGEVPDWAISLDGRFTFTDPRCE